MAGPTSEPFPEPSLASKQTAQIAQSFKTGDPVWVWAQEDRDEENEERTCFFATLDHSHGSFRPRIGMSEGWAPAVVTQDFTPTPSGAGGGQKGQKGGNVVHFKYEWRHWFNCRGVYAKERELNHYVPARYVRAREADVRVSGRAIGMGEKCNRSS